MDDVERAALETQLVVDLRFDRDEVRRIVRNRPALAPFVLERVLARRELADVDERAYEPVLGLQPRQRDVPGAESEARLLAHALGELGVVECHRLPR